MIKVLLYTDTFCDINGVSRFIQDIARISSQKELKFHVVTSSVKSCPKMDNVTLLKSRINIPIPFYPELHLVFPSYRSLKVIADEVEPDIIHISTPGYIGWKARKIAKKKKIPMIGTYHTDFPQFVYKNIPLKIIKRLSDIVMALFYKDFKAIFVRSEAYRNIVQDDVNFGAEHIHTLYPGIDTKKFNKSYKDLSIWDAYDIPQDAMKVLYVGRFTKEKNFPMLLDLWKEYYTNSEDKNIYLIAAGGDLEDESLFGTYHIKPVGIKRGEALSQLYASSDIFLFPSTTDTLGQVVMEAMSSGLPVVVSDIGGPMTLIKKDAPGGYFLDVNDKKSWLKTLDRLIKDPGLRQTLGENGHHQISKMDIENSFNAFWDVHTHYVEDK